MALRDRLGLRSPLEAQLARPTTRAVAVRERRDPTAATLPLSYQSPGAPMMAEWNAGEAYRWAYIANVWVYACVRAIATDLAALPFRAGADPDKPNDYNPNAPLARKLGPPPNGPAPKLSARRLWAWSIAQRIVTGRFAWELELAGREIAAMWPLVAANLKAIPSDRGSEWFRAFEYGRNERPVRLSPDQVFYAWNPSQNDFRQPESALQAARLDISVAVMQDRYDYAFLRNDARPASIVVTQAFAEQRDFDAFKDQFRGEYGGPDNAGKTAFVEADGDGDKGVAGAIAVTTLGLSQKDAEFIHRYESKVRGICVALGVPMSRLDASGRTFSNADAEGVHYWTTIQNHARDLQDDINLDLAPRLGSEVGWFDFSRVKALQDPPKFTSFRLRDLLDEEIVTRNEVRADFGLAAVDGLDEPMPKPAPAPVLAPMPANQPAVSALAEALAQQPADDDRSAERRHPHDDPEVRRAKIWSAADAQVRTLEVIWERSWRREFARQQRATISRLKGKRGRQAIDTETRAVNPSDIYDAGHWSEEGEQLAARLYEAVVAAGGPALAARFGLSFDVDAPYVERFIQQRSNQLAGQVTDTTYAAIKEAMARGVAKGEGIEEIAARIRHVFDVASESRATLIARTEVISAYNGSATLVASELGADVIGGKEWIATRDARVRPEHAEADGQVVPVDASFIVGGGEYDYPSDPNCRCTVAFLTPYEMAALSGRSRSHDDGRVVPFDRAARLAVRVAQGRLDGHTAAAMLRPTPQPVAEPAQQAEPDLATLLAQVLARGLAPTPVHGPRSRTIERDADGRLLRVVEE